jgi:hypothetical protein
MTTDPTFFTVSYQGRQYPISAYPFGPRAGSGTQWSVLTPDRCWHIVCSRDLKADTADERRRVEVEVVNWLSNFD